MRKVALGAALISCLAVNASSQEPPPRLLLRAAQCLEAKKFLQSSNSTKLTFGYLLDEKSYPNEKVIYLVNYPTHSRLRGLVFAVFLNDKDGNLNFNVQNNASFILSKSEPSGVTFENPPLGGAWTQEHLASAIKQIEKQPRFTIPVKELSAVDVSASCESYADPQRKESEK